MDPRRERERIYGEGRIWLPLVVTIAAAIWFVLGNSIKKNKRETPSNPAPIVDNTTASASASTPAADLVGEYEVFLSFRGIDTRYGFTDYLYHDLIGAGVRTFRDDNELPVGEEIGAELPSAIKQSKISIPIFSKNYAFSKWCLRELAHMVECRANGGQLIYPIFYDVEPNDVQHCEKGSYKDAFLKHENDKELDEKTVQQWKAALEIVGDLKGLELKKVTNGHEGKFVKEFVEEVLSKLKKNNQRVPEYLVGMDSHIEKMEGLLNSDSNGLVIIGIIGMGGLGKTTIAKVIYNKFSEHFKRSCFLEDVREKSKHCNGIDDLQTKLLSEILKRKIDSDSKGLYKIKDAVQGQKVFLVLDDVDEKFPIEELLGDPSWYEAGSRIIITTRTVEVPLALESTYQNKGWHEVYRCYRPNLMDDNLALQLFSKCAFKEDSPPKGYDDLAMKVVSSAGGLPLVLKTLGSLLLIEKDKVSWQDKLKKLQAIPPEEVLGRLKISYDALDDVQKQIFLDIACFFSREDKTNPYYMWDDCEFYPGEGITALVRRSLITVGDDNRLWMHDKLRELGEQIIYGKYQDKLEKGSRLWRPEDAWDLLEKQLQGTKNVKLLCLNPRSYDRARLRGEDFRKLPNLRYLRMKQTGLHGDFKNLLQNLRWLQWKDFSENCAPINLHLKNLVVLDLCGSFITDDWVGWSQIKMSNKLKVLKLSYCLFLTRIPHLSAFPTLERLELESCLSLCRLDGLEELESLKYLNAFGCSDLESLPDLSKLTSLQTLNVNFCWRLTEIQGLSKLTSLQTLDVKYCKKLTEIQGLDRLSSLEDLKISNCGSLKELCVVGCESLENLLNLPNTRIQKDSEDTKMSKRLKVLDISYCHNLTRIPHLSAFPTLERLQLEYCTSLRRLDGLEELESLKYLDASGCRALESLPNLSKLTRLQTLNIESCKQLTEIQGLSKLTSLQTLDVNSCSELTEIQGLSKLTSLQTLDVKYCYKLTEIQGLSKLTSLQTLDVSSCKKLTEIQGLDKLESLEILNMSFCKALKRLPNLSNLQKLTRFDSAYCKKLVEIQGLDILASLEYLDIEGCKSLKSLPDLSNLTNLKVLDVSHCVKLTELLGLEELKFLETLQVVGCESLENLPNLPNTMIQMDSEDEDYPSSEESSDYPSSEEPSEYLPSEEPSDYLSS